MVDKVTFKVEGLTQLGLRMKELRTDVAQKIAHASVSAGARVIRDRARQKVRINADHPTGSLLDAVVTKKLRSTNLTSEYIVTVRRGPIGSAVTNPPGPRQKRRIAPHAIFLEFGTVKMPAEPYLRPAFEEGKSDALNAIVNRLRKRIEAAERGK